MLKHKAGRVLNRMLLDERILFPSAFLAGFAKIDLARRCKSLSIEGFRNRGLNSIALEGTHNSQPIQLSVRYRVINDDSLVITTVHRRVRLQGCPFGSMTDDRREFVEQEPETQLVLRPSFEAFRAYWMGAMAGKETNIALMQDAKRRMEQRLAELPLFESFVATANDGGFIWVSPVKDLAKVSALVAA